MQLQAVPDPWQTHCPIVRAGQLTPADSTTLVDFPAVPNSDLIDPALRFQEDVLGNHTRWTVFCSQAAKELECYNVVTLQVAVRSLGYLKNLRYVETCCTESFLVDALS